MKRPILFSVVTILFLVSLTLFAYNIVNVFIPMATELIEGKGFQTFESDMMPLVGETSADVSGMFNERGFYKSASVTYDENEIINDYNGNLMYSFPLFSEKGPGDIYLDMSLNYNGAINYQVFAANLDWMTNNVMPRYNITAPGWIFSVNGMAVQMLNFETNFFTVPSSGDEVKNDHIRLLTSGYQITESVGPINNSTDKARIMIMKGDGSVITLLKMPPYDCTPPDDPNCYVGDFYSENKGDYTRAKVEFIEYGSPLPPPMYRNRRASVMRGDGLTYIYDEYKIQYTDFEVHQGSNIFKPQVFLLKKIKDRFGYTLNIDYITPFIGFRGRWPIHRITGSWNSPAPDIEFRIGTGNNGFVGIYNHGKGAYKLFTDGFTYESGWNHRPFPERLENPAGDNIYFESEAYNRTAENLKDPNQANHYFSLRFDKILQEDGESLRRLKTVINYNNGKREYNYMPEGDGLTINMQPESPNKIQSTDSNRFFGQGRDMFFNNMLNEVKVYDEDELIRRETFEYKYYDVDGNRLWNPVDDKDLNFTTRSIFSEEPEFNYNTPTTLRTKTFYRNYKLFDPQYNPRNPDFPGHTKKIWEKFYTTNENDPYKRIDYGFLADGVSGSLFYGSFLDTNVTENIKGFERVRSFRYIHDSGPLTGNGVSNNPLIESTEYDPFRIKTVVDYLIFYDPENVNYVNGYYNPYGSNETETTPFYLLGQLETMEKFYNEVNGIYKEKYEYHTSNNDDGYIGQLKEKKIHNSDNYNDYKRIQFKYFIKDTLGIYLYPGSGKPSTEGNLKEVIDPKGNSTKFYYHPVSGEYCSGTSNPPRIIYKKLLYDGSIVQDTSTWVDIRMPTITENIPNGNVSLLSFKEYNKTGNVTNDLNQYLYLTEFNYDGMDRLVYAALPYNFDTSQSYDSIAVDTTLIPIEYTLDSDAWGYYTENQTTDYCLVNWDYQEELFYKGPVTLIYYREGGPPPDNPTDISRLPLLRFDANDTIPNSLSQIDSAFFIYYPTYLHTNLNNDTSTSILELQLQTFRYISIKHDENNKCGFNFGYEKGSGQEEYDLPGSIPKEDYCITLKSTYPSYYQSVNITEMLNEYLVNQGETLAGLSLKIIPKNTYPNPHEDYNMYLSWCIRLSNLDGILPSTWISNYAPRIKIKGTYRYINSRVIKVHPKATLRYAYDDVRNRTDIFSAFDHQTDKRTEHLFDGFYRIKKSKLYTTENDFDSTEVMYNYLDLQAKTIDGRGNASKFSYDEFLNLKQTENADNSSTLIENVYQNGLGYSFGNVPGLVNMQKFIDEEGNEFIKYFNAVGNLLRETKYVYGIPTEGEGYETIPVYTDYRYDSLYRVTHVKTPEGKIISYSYDGYGRQSQRTTPDAGTVKYKYDKTDNLRFSQDANQDASSSDLVTFRGYDGINRLLYIGEAPSESGEPNGGWYSLNPDQVMFFENYSQYPHYFLTINVYDTLSTAYGGEFSPPGDYYNTINYTKGNLLATAYRTRGSDNWNYKYYRYDVRGRVIRMWHVIDGLDTKVIDYTYNSQNQVTTMKYQFGNDDEYKRFRYTYDKAGRLTDVDIHKPDPVGPPDESGFYENFTSYEYNQNSQVSKHSLNNDETFTNYTYNSRNWIQSALDNNIIFRYYLSYYNNGNVGTQALNGNYRLNFSNTDYYTVNYTYDPSNRLLKADAGATNTFDLENTYDYDGNLKTMKRYGSNNNLLDDFNYDYISGTNKLSNVMGDDAQFTYDQNGNVTSDILSYNGSMVYDHRNLLIESMNYESINFVFWTRYYYDEAGNRIRKLTLVNTGGGIPDPPNWDDVGNMPIYDPEMEGGEGGWFVMTNKLYVRGVGGNELAIYNLDQLEQWNVWGTDNVGKITKEGEEENKFFYLKDHLGSIRAVIDNRNDVVNAQDYDMWGFLLENRMYNIDEAKYKFTGKERDIESSYDYFGARYYMSRIGRWGSVEPMYDEYLQFSPYSYALLNPLLYFDYEGNDGIVSIDNASKTINIEINIYYTKDPSYNLSFSDFKESRLEDYMSEAETNWNKAGEKIEYKGEDWKVIFDINLKKVDTYVKLRELKETGDEGMNLALSKEYYIENGEVKKNVPAGVNINQLFIFNLKGRKYTGSHELGHLLGISHPADYKNKLLIDVMSYGKNRKPPRHWNIRQILSKLDFSNMEKQIIKGVK